MDKIYDFVGIGVGPFNLSLACLTDPIEELDGIFVDQRVSFDWHAGMLLEDTTLQVPFLADLVTMADPTSPYSFLNYIKQQGRLYSFYIKEDFLLLRNEYNQYCQWAVEQLSNIYFSTKVVEVYYEASNECYAVVCLCTKTGVQKLYRGKKLVLGTGTSPYIPDCAANIDEQVIHSSSYLMKKRALQHQKAITIVGSGQSAAEIFYDLLTEIDHYGYTLNWITRSPRFFPLEYTKLTLEMTSPDYLDYFYNLPKDKKEALVKNQKQLYKGINGDLIANIFDLLYTKRLMHKVNVGLRTNSTLKNAYTTDGKVILEIHQHEQDKYYRHQTEAVIMATGYTYRMPKFLKGIYDRICWNEEEQFDVQRNYAVDKEGCEVFVQNAELHTHGFVTPDLGMGCYRNSSIIKAMTGREYYPIEKRIAFQQFDVMEEEEIPYPSNEIETPIETVI
ncbi:lysine N(6)-hydroxylase/L-ornithine N(5)-oxygenase family protein [Limibacter armeniacum]|uniref:lysine N(6)-hydroxylase/L-ornithine N(5)-oxygenase family protein n=1 Tax=Limibacter armeniacum TaxID=466084 RepID=UPI002FE66547